MHEAKKRLVLNVTTNILLVLVNALVTLWMTPYLIKHLGVAAYGLIPLVFSIVHYFDILTLAISSTLGRFVAIHLNRAEWDASNKYYNTAVFGLLGLCILLVIPGSVMAFLLPHFFDIPPGIETQAIWLFVFIMLTSFLIAFSSPFMVGTFVKHRFELSNVIKISARLLQPLLLILLFKYISTSVSSAGISYLAFAVVSTVGFVIINRVLLPELKLQIGKFDWKALRDMLSMGCWMIIDQIGTLLYLGIDLVIINVLLGAKAAGQYAPLLQWATLLMVMGQTITSVFAPVAIEYIAKGQLQELAFQTKRSIRFMCLLTALPVGLLCGFAKPLLITWLGSDFAGLSWLMVILIGPQVVLVAISPLYNINRGMNKVKIPAIMTLIGGILNLVTAVALVRWTSLGLYGVALAVTVSFLLRCMFFSAIYGAIIMNQAKMVFLKPLIPGVFLTIAVYICSMALSTAVGLFSYVRLFVAGLVIAILFFAVLFAIILRRDERVFILSLIIPSMRQNKKNVDVCQPVL